MMHKLQLTQTTNMEYVPGTEEKVQLTKICVVCSEKSLRKESRYQCKECLTKSGLCVVPCFREYHT